MTLIGRSGAPSDPLTAPITLHQEMIISAGGTGQASLAVTGEVDASNADELRLAILDAASTHGVLLDVDLAGVTFMDSSGLRAIADSSLALEQSWAWARVVQCAAPCAADPGDH